MDKYVSDKRDYFYNYSDRKYSLNFTKFDYNIHLILYSLKKYDLGTNNYTIVKNYIEFNYFNTFYYRKLFRLLFDLKKGIYTIDYIYGKQSKINFDLISLSTADIGSIVYLCPNNVNDDNCIMWGMYYSKLSSDTEDFLDIVGIDKIYSSYQKLITLLE